MKTLEITSKKGYTDEYKFSCELNFTDGTEKQQSWAFNIVSEKISDVIGMLTGNAKDPVLGEKYYNMFAQVTSAIFWIDNRDETWQNIAKSLLNK